MVDDPNSPSEPERQPLVLNEYLRSALNASPLGMALLSNDAVATFRNRAYGQMLGYSEDELARTSFEQLSTVLARETLRAELTAVWSHRGVARPPVVLQLLHRDGQVIDVEARIAPVEVDGEVSGRLIVFRDITAELAAARSVAESEAQLRAVFDASTNGLTFRDKQGRPVFRNRAHAEMLGYEAEAIQRMDAREFVAPYDLDRMLAERAESIDGGPIDKEFAVDLVHRDGRIINTVARTSDVTVAGELIGSVIDTRDVTEELARQRELKESEAQLARGQAIAHVGTSSIDLNTGKRTWSDEVYRLFGLEPGSIEPSPTALEPYMNPDDRKRMLEAQQAAEQRDGQVDVTVRSMGADGVARTLSVHSELTRDSEGCPLRWDGTLRDVTEELEARRALEASSAQLARGQEFAHVGTWSIDIATGEQLWTDELYRLFGLEPGSIEPSQDVALQFIEPADRARLMDEAARSRESGDGGGVDVRVRTVGADGVARTLWIRSELTRDTDGQPLRWEGATQDVTRLSRAEQRLREREEFLRSTFEAIQSGILVFTDGRVVSANPRATEILGYSEAELRGRTAFDLVSEEDAPQVLRGYEALQQDGPQLFIDRYRAQRKDGVWIDIETRTAPMRREGDLRASVVDIRDVTEELALQREVESNAERLNTVFETVSTGLIVIGEALRPITANKAACAILGYRHEELMRKTVAQLGDPVGAKALVTRIAESIEQGRKMEVVQARAVRGDGAWIDVELTIEPFRVDGKIVGALCEIRDVTEKNTAERQLAVLHAELEARARERQALARQLLVAQEEERRTVAYDIHDGPAQQLAAAQMFLETYAYETGTDIDSAAAKHLQRAKTYLKDGLKETRRIMSGLRPSLLDDLGLTDAIRQLLTDLTEAAPVTCEFDAGALNAEAPAEIEITLFRIVQEAVGNALKYSATDRIRVTLWSDGASIQLEVRDWGAGFDSTKVRSPRDGHHFGLAGMRERIELLDGRFTIESARGAGTTISAEIPLG